MRLWYRIACRYMYELRFLLYNITIAYYTVYMLIPYIMYSQLLCMYSQLLCMYYAFAILYTYIQLLVRYSPYTLYSPYTMYSYTHIQTLPLPSTFPSSSQQVSDDYYNIDYIHTYIHEIPPLLNITLTNPPLLNSTGILRSEGPCQPLHLSPSRTPDLRYNIYSVCQYMCMWCMYV